MKKKLNLNPFKMVLPYCSVIIFLFIFFRNLKIWNFETIVLLPIILSTISVLSFMFGWGLSVFIRFIWNLIFKKSRIRRRK